MGGKLPTDRVGKRPEPEGDVDSALAEIALRIVDTVVARSVHDALREAYQLGLQHGRMAQ